MYPDSSHNSNHETKTAIYFFSSAFDPLNNWSANSVQIWGKKFPTAEHAYHFSKFSDNHPEIAEEIRRAPSPWAAMQIERKNHGKRQKREVWDKVKSGIMTEIVRAKVAQNEDVKECLLKTGDKQIIENSPWDSFWGCGKYGKGQNQMGKILMKIRTELTKE